MIDLNDLYNRFCSENNTYQGGLFRPERDFERAVNTESIAIWNDWTAQAEKSQEIIDNLAPFLKTAQLPVESTKNNYGVVKYPKDYGRFSSARILVHENDKSKCYIDTSIDVCDTDGECLISGSKETEEQKQKRKEDYKNGISEHSFTKVSSNKWAALLNHRSKKPTFEKPAMTQNDGGFKIAPRQASVVVLDYYVEPVYAKYVYTVSPGNEQTGAGDFLIYDANRSGKLQWNESMIPEFLNRLSKVYGKYIRSEFIVQTSQIKP